MGQHYFAFSISVTPCQMLVVSNAISQCSVCEQPSDSQNGQSQSMGRIKSLITDIMISLDAHDWLTAKSRTQELSQCLQTTQGYV